MLIHNSSAIREDSIRFSLLASARKLGRLRSEYPAARAFNGVAGADVFLDEGLLLQCDESVFHLSAVWLCVPTPIVL